MRSIVVAVALIIALAPLAVPSPEAALGARFADLYSSFAPLYALYRSYADHLFTGAPVAVPAGIGDSCRGMVIALTGLSSDRLTQTPSTVLAYLRIEVLDFCLSYRSVLEEIERAPVDRLIPLLDRASDEHLFSSIYELNGMLEEALSQTLLTFGEGGKQWRFAVAFAVRTILDRDRIDKIDEDLREIFYGEGGDSPPVEIPDGVSAAMAALIALSGRPLTAGEADRARYLAEYIECYFVFDTLLRD